MPAADGIGSLNRKTVAVTGGTGGIGSVIVNTLLKYGCDIVVIDAPQAKAAMEKLEAKLGSRVRCVACNMMDAAACSAVAEKAGSVDHLVNAAGLARISPLMEQTAQDWDLTLNLNAKAVFLVSQSFARQWIKQGKKGGSICNISSQASQAPLPGHLTYCASKAAVDLITRMMAMELGPHGIRVNAVNPTVVLTAMGRENWSDPKKAGPMLSGIPLNRFAEPDEVSEVIAWLLCDAAAMVNGVQLPIDGGFINTRMNLMPKSSL